MRAAAESSRMRSFVCCGVSRTACARLGGARTTTPSRVMETRHNVPAPSLAGCIRIDDPQDDYTGRRTKSITEFDACDRGECLRNQEFAWRAGESRSWQDLPAEKRAERLPGCAD